ncbi:10668_t:CDS:2, partial [Acaulospora colombiana]
MKLNVRLTHHARRLYGGPKPPGWTFDRSPQNESHLPPNVDFKPKFWTEVKHIDIESLKNIWAWEAGGFAQGNM